MALIRETVRHDGTLIYCWNPKVATRTLDGTAFVLLNSRMVSLNPVGTCVWDLLRDGSSVHQVAEIIAQEFDTTLRIASRDTAAFVEGLLQRRLLEKKIDDGPLRADEPQKKAASVNRSTALERQPYAPPSIAEEKVFEREALLMACRQPYQCGYPFLTPS